MLLRMCLPFGYCPFTFVVQRMALSTLEKVLLAILCACVGLGGIYCVCCHYCRTRTSREIRRVALEQCLTRVRAPLSWEEAIPLSGGLTLAIHNSFPIQEKFIFPHGAGVPHEANVPQNEPSSNHFRSDDEGSDD